jgi:hypothetical protein
MSLDVSPELLAQAEAGPVDAGAFLATVRTSLPYAYNLVASLAGQLAAGGRQFADNQNEPSEAERGQLLRALSSDSIRSALQENFGVRLAFQNCHRLAVFPAGSENTEAYRAFVSPRAQLLNQSPLLRSC